MGFHCDLLSIAVPQIDRGPFSCWLNLQIFEAAPVIDDLIQSLLTVIFVAELCNRLLPRGCRLNVLTTVLVRLSHHIACQLGVAVVAPLKNLTIDLE